MVESCCVSDEVAAFLVNRSIWYWNRTLYGRLSFCGVDDELSWVLAECLRRSWVETKPASTANGSKYNALRSFVNPFNSANGSADLVVANGRWVEVRREREMISVRMLW